MPGEPVDKSQEIARAYAENDRKVTVNNIQIGCIVGMVLMPAGVTLDWFVYKEWVWKFLGLRLLCSLLIGLFWLVVVSPWGRRHHRALGVTLAMFPTACIAAMILLTDGWNSPYYAGLNLVLLVVGLILHWTFFESLVAVALVTLMYVAACWANGAAPQEEGVWFNNLYFIVLTGVVVVTGSYFQSRLRFREFEAKYQLDLSRRELEASNKKLMELDEVKSRFFANISHELRTPLTLLLAPLESLVVQSSSGMDPQAREWLETMQNNGMRLLKLINDLLDLVRLESGKVTLKLENLDLGAFLHGLSTSVRKVADDKRIKLSVSIQDGLPAVPADRDKLEKIVLNLLFNAIKFTPSGGQITLSAARQDESVLISVADTGVGIAEDQLANVFSRFWQADTSSQRKHQGAGIGLALVKELVEAHGGTVDVQSMQGQGTTMRVLLPLKSVEEIEEPEGLSESTSAPAPVQDNAWLDGLYRRAELFPSVTSPKDAMLPVELPGRGPQKTVLVADDEPDMLKFLKSQLSRHYQVLEAVDGQQAVEKAAQFLPDLLLVDMMMPEKDGLQVCRDLRARTSTQSIPIIMLTARADEPTKLAALSSGANDFLPKPFSGTELHVRIRNLVQAHELQRNLVRQNKILEATLEQLKETESQLVQAEKMASLGRMSAGIIHEINNPLNFAKTGLHTLKGIGESLPDDRRELYEDILKDIQEGVDRVKNIVSDLRTFTHPKADHHDLMPVEPALTAALRFLSHEWKDKVVMNIRLPDGFSIWGNHNKIVQVLVNLLQNSLDALASRPSGSEPPSIEIEAREERGRKLLVIRDNGPGISGEDQLKIFDPFFTTKDVGAGMGLGLSICYRIIEEHQGRILVRSEAGRFCEFTLEFPAELPESH